MMCDTETVMGKYFCFVVIILLFNEVVSAPRRKFHRVLHLRELTEVSTESSKESSPETTTPESPPLTPSYPPRDPNDACHGCTYGQVCQMVIPPCLRPPPECHETTPDPSLDCAQYANYCKPVPACIDYSIAVG
ncbi:hypothetical protein Bpfe_026174 [Biomphalaria pfeifferi]|uniref:Uncharacterized protein n=1 Tax=Biomphalaria pfeifferi TaxID=112525 RepID=A0AAD8AZ57_BIOPF|nr:hypothetical protein Bpfe_026174 [Biomphalaria pfeifferi]